MKSIVLTSLALVFSVFAIKAQDFSNPGAYISAISNAQTEMNQKYMAYVSAASHGKRARKVEKLRLAALESITACKYKTIEIPFYKGDNSLRQSSIDYIQMCYNVFNDDYAKIVNMEEIAEQSFDQMQAYILLQEKTSEKLKEAAQKMTDAEKAFATKYNVTLVDGGKNELSEKMDIAGKLNHYNNQIYLLFFKCNWQDNAMNEAIKAQKITDIEQARNAVIKYANEGIQALDTLKQFNGDPSLAIACKQVLLAYKKSAETDIPKVTDFLLKEENFNKLKKTMETSSNRTKENVDAYNKAVKEMNDAINVYNQANANMVNTKNQSLAEWDKTVKEFMDKHMPYYKK